jgi:hypothetical protein
MDPYFCKGITIVSNPIYPSCDFGVLTHFLQLRSAWVPQQSVCGVLDTDSSNKNALATLVSDVVLLITMLVGLLRLRKRDLLSGFAQLLWKQVGCAASRTH